MEKSREFLKTFNRKVFEELERDDIQLIGDISLDDDSYQRLEDALSVLLKANFQYNAKLFKESLVLLLVKNAERYYDGSFWEHLKFDFNVAQRSFTRDLFLTVCERHGFPAFEDEAQKGYGIITPYICHSRVPNEELPHFFALFENYFDNGEVQAFLNQIFQRPYLVRPHTERFLVNYLDADAFPFLLQWDEVTRVYNDDITAEDAFTHLEISFEGEPILVPLRFIKHYIDWQKIPAEQPGKKSTKRHRYRSPQIALDLDARCLVLNIPEQEIPIDLVSGYRDKLIWIIEYAGEISRVETYIYKNVLTNKHLTDAISLKLRQPTSLDDDLSLIGVQAYINDINQYLHSWDLPFAPEDYIVFDDSGKIVHSNRISKKNVILFAAEHLKVISGEAYHDSVVFWPNYRLHSIAFGDLEAVTVENSISGKTYAIEKKLGPNIPELRGGIVFQNNPSIYQKLPILAFPETIDDSLSVEIQHVESKDNKPVEQLKQEINLSDVIDATRYGTYDLRIRQENKTIDRKRFSYIPKIDFVDEGDYWPEPEIGYKHDRHYRFETSKDVRITLEGFFEENQQVEAGKRKVWFRVAEEKPRYHGRISFHSELSGGEINIDFQMAARPILWAIESSANDSLLLEYTDKPIFFTNEQIRALASKEPYLFVAAGNLGSEVVEGKLIVTDRQGNDIYTTDFQLRSGGAFSFPLLNVFMSDAIRKSEQYQINIQLFSPYGELIGGSAYPLVVVSPTIEFSDFHVEREGLFVRFTWRDDGELTERGLFLADLSRPWEAGKYYPILEDLTSVSLPQTILKDGIYSAKVDVPKRQSPFGRHYFEPTIWSENFPLQTSHNEIGDLLVAFNYHWLSYLLFDNGDANVEQLKKLSPKPVILDVQQAMNLVKTYLTIRALESKINYSSEVKKQKFRAVERVYRNLAREVVVPAKDMLKAILDEGFHPKDYFDIFSFFELVQLTDREIQSMNWIEAIHKISDQLPDLAFQITMATNRYHRNVEKWIGTYTLNELLELPQGSDPITVMQERFENDNKMKMWASHPDYWGSYQDIVAFMTQLRSDMNRGRFKNMPIPEYIEYITYYESQYKKGTRKLFDKSFIRKRQDLQHEINTHEDGYSKLNDYLESCVRVDINPYRSKLNHLYPMAMDRISKIRDPDDETIVADIILYNAYLIMFVVTLYRQGKWEHGSGYLLRNADRIRRYFRELYNHMLVVFDLYLRDGGQ